MGRRNVSIGEPKNPKRVAFIDAIDITLQIGGMRCARNGTNPIRFKPKPHCRNARPTFFNNGMHVVADAAWIDCIKQFSNSTKPVSCLNETFCTAASSLDQA